MNDCFFLVLFIPVVETERSYAIREIPEQRNEKTEPTVP